MPKVGSLNSKYRRLSLVTVAVSIIRDDICAQLHHPLPHRQDVSGQRHSCGNWRDANSWQHIFMANGSTTKNRRFAASIGRWAANPAGDLGHIRPGEPAACHEAMDGVPSLRIELRPRLQPNLYFLLHRLYPVAANTGSLPPTRFAIPATRGCVHSYVRRQVAPLVRFAWSHWRLVR